mmetsp:Transcript_13666/g.32538  ORF Transcript_13666/g.32538 Transcript_13666/m.32538 type:complete len:116 (-) Transcript_13666:215-562(-)
MCGQLSDALEKNITRDADRHASHIRKEPYGPSLHALDGVSPAPNSILSLLELSMLGLLELSALRGTLRHSCACCFSSPTGDKATDSRTYWLFGGDDPSSLTVADCCCSRIIDGDE